MLRVVLYLSLLTAAFSGPVDVCPGEGPRYGDYVSLAACEAACESSAACEDTIEFGTVDGGKCSGGADSCRCYLVQGPGSVGCATTKDHSGFTVRQRTSSPCVDGRWLQASFAADTTLAGYVLLSRTSSCCHDADSPTLC